MTNKLAIVTGGARGIGRGCAHALADKGFDVAIIDLLMPEMQRTQANKGLAALCIGGGMGVSLAIERV